MDETFVRRAFQQFGENVLNVKVMRNKFTGELAGYCFVQFPDEHSALSGMHRLNGKVIPNSNPPVRFKLNHTGARNIANEREFSLWVGELSPDVDDYILFKGFASRYASLKSAKVILDAGGTSKGYGFIRFDNEVEQKDAMINMNGYKGIGSKALKISLAIPKTQRAQYQSHQQQQQQPQQPVAAAATLPTAGYGYDQSYWQNYAAWQQQPYNAGATAGYYETPAVAALPKAQPQSDDLQLVDHSEPMDVDRVNMEFIANNNEFWDAVEASRWTPADQFQIPTVAAAV